MYKTHDICHLCGLLNDNYLTANYDYKYLIAKRFTPWCYAERVYATVCCPSICLSVCDIQVLWSNRLEYFENNFTAE